MRGTVEKTVNSLLDAEVDRLCNAQRYERTEARRDTRAGHYERSIEIKPGEVTLKVPKLRHRAFETAIIERYRRREASVEEALIEMHLAGVSVRRVEDITDALWGTRVSPSTVADLNQKIFATIEAWRNRPSYGASYVAPFAANATQAAAWSLFRLETECPIPTPTCSLWDWTVRRSSREHGPLTCGCQLVAKHKDRDTTNR